MKRILVLFLLSLVTTLAYANCPSARDGYVFRVAAWGNHQDATSQVRCYYYKQTDLSQSYESDTYDYYYERSLIGPNWWHQTNYAECTSRNTDVNECPFQR